MVGAFSIVDCAVLELLTGIQGHLAATARVAIHGPCERRLAAIVELGVPTRSALLILIE